MAKDLETILVFLKNCDREIVDSAWGHVGMSKFGIMEDEVKGD